MKIFKIFLKIDQRTRKNGEYLIKIDQNYGKKIQDHRKFRKYFEKLVKFDLDNKIIFLKIMENEVKIWPNRFKMRKIEQKIAKLTRVKKKIFENHRKRWKNFLKMAKTNAKNDVKCWQLDEKWSKLWKQKKLFNVMKNVVKI